MSIDVILIYVFLFVLISYFTIFYYRRVREASRDYFRAKTVLDDIIISFNRDIQRTEERIREVIGKNEESAVENAQVLEEINSRITSIKVQLEDLSRNGGGLLRNHEDLRKKVEDITSQQSELFNKINELESSYIQMNAPRTRLTRINSVIQTRGEGTLGSLTDTELKVLELLATEGEKTAPEIKDIIKLTREHTARLMKSLYARGYLERKTVKIPYVYYLNKEMNDLLSRQKI